MSKVMKETQELAARPSGEVQAQTQSQAREPEYALIPPADIFEDADGISVVLDMPGVAKDRLNVKADGNGLVVEGEAKIPMPEGMEPIYADIRSTHYRRSFGLTSELDTGQTEAALKDGVLTIDLSKDFLVVQGSEQRTAVAQLVFTATGAPDVDSVLFAIEGAQKEVPVDDGSLSAQPLTVTRKAQLKLHAVSFRTRCQPPIHASARRTARREIDLRSN